MQAMKAGCWQNQKIIRFGLGILDTHSYEELFYGDKVQELADVACASESLPGCSDCAFQSYCGSDPIHNHATTGEIFGGYRPTSTFVKKTWKSIRHLIQLMDGDGAIKRVFETWVKPQRLLVTLRTKGIPYSLNDFIVGIVTRDVSTLDDRHVLFAGTGYSGSMPGFAGIITTNTFAPELGTPCVFRVCVTRTFK